MKVMFFVLGIFGLLFLSGSQLAAAKEVNEEAVVREEGAEAVNVGNKICPVSGEEINEETRATYEYQGLILNFCTPECIEEFKKDPEKYMKRVEEELKARAEEEEPKELEPEPKSMHEEHLY